MGMKLSKVLVFANVFVSIGLLAWAVSIYTNRIAYFDGKDGETAVPGQYAQYTAEIKRLTDGSQLAQGAYSRAMDNLVGMEQERAYRGFVLAMLLEEVRRPGNTRAVFRNLPRHEDTENRGLVRVRLTERRDAEGKIVPQDTLEATFPTPALDLRNQPLKGFGRVGQEMVNLLKEEKDKTEQIRKLREDTNKMSLEITNPSDKTGLQPEVFKMKTIFQNLGDEDLFLADAQVNWDEQLRTLKVRKQQLLARLGEPTKPAAATEKGGE